MAAQAQSVKQCVYVKAIQKHVRVLEQDTIAIIQDQKLKHVTGVAVSGNIRLSPNVLYKEIKGRVI